MLSASLNTPLHQSWSTGCHESKHKDILSAIGRESPAQLTTMIAALKSHVSYRLVGHFESTCVKKKGRGMCYPVCGMVHMKEPLLLIGKSSLCGGSGIPFSLSEWSLTICLTLYNRK